MRVARGWDSGALNERVVVVEKAATRGRGPDAPGEDRGRSAGDLRMLLAGRASAGRRVGSAPIAFALASTLSLNARILRRGRPRPEGYPARRPTPDGDAAVVVVAVVVAVVALIPRGRRRGRDLTGVALEDGAEWRYGDSNVCSGSRQRTARSAAAFLAPLALAAATRSSARILPTLSRAVLARTAACMRAAASCRTLVSSRARLEASRFEARSRLIALTRSRAALPRWMRCIRTAAACSSSGPANVRWGGAPRASTRAASHLPPLALEEVPLGPHMSP